MRVTLPVSTNSGPDGNLDMTANSPGNQIGTVIETNDNIAHQDGKIGGTFKTTSGNVDLTRSTVVENLNITSDSGTITLEDLRLNQDSDFTANASAETGAILLRNIGFLNKVSTVKGHINIFGSKANSIETENGTVVLRNTEATTVRCPSRSLTIEQSRRIETLRTAIGNGGQLKIGPNSLVETIRLEAEAEGSSSISFNNVRISDISNSEVYMGAPSRLSSTSKIRFEDVEIRNISGGSTVSIGSYTQRPHTQGSGLINVKVHIGNNSTVNNIEFDAEKFSIVTIVLGRNARYTGPQSDNIRITSAEA